MKKARDVTGGVCIVGLPETFARPRQITPTTSTIGRALSVASKAVWLLAFAMFVAHVLACGWHGLLALEVSNPVCRCGHPLASPLQ